MMTAAIRETFALWELKSDPNYTPITLRRAACHLHRLELYKTPFTEGELCDRDGSYLPLSATRAERDAKGGTRLSLEERYGSHANYVGRLEATVQGLVKERFLLAEDAERYIKASKEDAVAERFAR